MKTTKKSLSLAVGTALGASLALSPMALAESNPFGATEMSSGYMQVASGHKAKGEGKCGEGKCGGEKAHGEGKCGEGKCGGEKAKGEGKCGEGKCGGNS